MQIHVDLGVLVLLAILVISAICLVLVWKLWKLMRPAVQVRGRREAHHAPLVTDPADPGCHVTVFAVASPVPLTFGGARYLVDLGHGPTVVDGSAEEAIAALRQAGIDGAAFAVTRFPPGTTFVPGQEHVAFALAMPVVRRLRRLEAVIGFTDPLGRRVTRVLSALPQPFVA